MPEAKPLVLQTGDGVYTGSPSPVSIAITVAGLTATDLNAGLAELAGEQATVGTTIKSSGSVALVGGTATVATAGALTASRIFLTVGVLGTVTVANAVAVTGRTNAVSFTITSAAANDTSTIYWMILN